MDDKLSTHYGSRHHEDQSNDRQQFAATVREMTEHKRAENELLERARQQAAVAELGQHALADIDLTTLMDRAVGLVAGTMRAEYCKVLELLAPGKGLLLRAGEGWQEGLVGRAIVDAGTDSQAGYTLQSNEPVIVKDLRTETRFNGPLLLHDHGVISGMSVIIHGRDRPFGVLSVHNKEQRTFTKDDVNFLRAVANVLAGAIERRQAEETLKAQIRRNELILGTSHDGFLIVGLEDTDLREVNDAYCRMLGYTRAELLTKKIADVEADKSPEEIQAHIEKILAQGYDRFETRHRRKDGGLVDLEVSASLAELGEDRFFFTFVRDITDRKRLEEALTALAESTASAAGDDFIRTWVRDLARAYGARYAFAGVFTDKSQTSIRTLAVWAGDGFAENFEYPLTGTPCQDILNCKIEFIPHDAAKYYPDFALLAELGVEGYFGARLTASSQAPMGLVSVMDVRPLALSHWSEPILGVFAKRIAQELERKDAEAALRESEEKARLLLESTGEAIYGVDLDGNCTFANPASLRLLGYDDMAELIGKNMHDLTHHTRRDGTPHPAEDCGIRRAFLEGQGTHTDDDMLWRKDGTCFPVENWSYPMRRKGKIVGAVVKFIDVTERRRTETQVGKLSRALEQTADTVVITDRNGVIEYVNPAFEQVTGYSRAEAVGGKPNLVKSGLHDSGFYKQLWGTILGGNVFRDVVINRKQDGTLYYEEKTITPLKDAHGQITHFISTGKDITERMENQERLRYLAYHDVLTNLPNRALFMDRLDHALSRIHRTHGPLAVLFMDLDRFKIINDTLGHNVGDRLLQTLSRRLIDSVREGDTVARFGGDEFAILLEDITQIDDVPPVAEKILDALGQAFVLEDGHELFVTTSIGISTYPNDAGDSVTLLKNADTAMYRAKEKGRNGYQFYAPEMSTKAFERLSLETSLRHALEREEFLLYYQPQVDLETGRVIGMEALLRWQHPDLGLVQPTEFIPLLEDTGLIVPAGAWVLRTACTQARDWQDAGLGPGRVSINLSSRQFTGPDFLESIKRTLAETGLSPDSLELEITENVIMDNAQQTIETLQSLHAMGTRLAIDDFGTGYSSLSYLKRFPIDTLKIDRSFIRDIASDPGDAAIVKAIIAMAHSLKRNVIAEGVETEEQLTFLRANHCNGIQGYLFSRPLPPAEAACLLKEGNRLLD